MYCAIRQTTALSLAGALVFRPVANVLTLEGCGMETFPKLSATSKGNMPQIKDLSN